MKAKILAVGPFSRDLVNHLPFDQRYYESTNDGARIMVPVFGPMFGFEESSKLAACFGIDPWDFSKHKLDGTNADIEKLRALFGKAPTDQFVRLAKHGFEFYFLPNIN